MATTEISINLQDYFYSSPPFELFDFWAVVNIEEDQHAKRAEKIARVLLGQETADKKSELDEFSQNILEEVRRVGEIDLLLCELFRRGASSVTLVGVPSGLSGGGI